MGSIERLSAGNCKRAPGLNALCSDGLPQRCYRASYLFSADYIQMPSPSSYFEPINGYRTVCHELGHNAERRIMPPGPSNGWSAGLKPCGGSA
jgi:zincin-like metallopeptidase